MRYAPVRLTLDVPAGELLLAWAADAHKRHAAYVLFRAAAGGSPLETLALGAAYCVLYREEFHAGNTANGAYVCHLVLSDPDGFTIQAGGPAAAFVAPAARNHAGPGAALGALGGGGSLSKLPIIPLAANILPADWDGKKNLPSWTEEHKAARWAEYQRDKIGNPRVKRQGPWDAMYETARNNNVRGLKREREYAKSMNATSTVLKTAFTLRQIDMYKQETKYCGQLKTGKISLTAQAKVDLKKDEYLISKQYQVEYILEKGASKPMLEALKRIGADVKIGPQIP